MELFFQTWLPFIYLYGVGGILFAIGLIVIRKSGAINLNLKRHKYWYKVLIFGYLYFMAMHAFITVAALYF